MGNRNASDNGAARHDINSNAENDVNAGDPSGTEAVDEEVGTEAVNEVVEREAIDEVVEREAVDEAVITEAVNEAAGTEAVDEIAAAMELFDNYFFSQFQTLDMSEARPAIWPRLYRGNDDDDEREGRNPFREVDGEEGREEDYFEGEEEEEEEEDYEEGEEGALIEREEEWLEEVASTEYPLEEYCDRAREGLAIRDLFRRLTSRGELEEFMVRAREEAADGIPRSEILRNARQRLTSAGETKRDGNQKNTQGRLDRVNTGWRNTCFHVADPWELDRLRDARGVNIQERRTQLMNEINDLMTFKCELEMKIKDMGERKRGLLMKNDALFAEIEATRHRVEVLQERMKEQKERMPQLINNCVALQAAVIEIERLGDMQ